MGKAKREAIPVDGEQFANYGLEFDVNEKGTAIVPLSTNERHSVLAAVQDWLSKGNAVAIAAGFTEERMLDALSTGDYEVGLNVNFRVNVGSSAKVVKSTIRGADLETMTGEEALQELHKLKALLGVSN